MKKIFGAEAIYNYLHRHMWIINYFINIYQQKSNIVIKIKPGSCLHYISSLVKSIFHSYDRFILFHKTKIGIFY